MADEDAVADPNAENFAGLHQAGCSFNIIKTWPRIPGRMVVEQNDRGARWVIYGWPEDLFWACRYGQKAPHTYSGNPKENLFDI